jgi:hypothetical protein
MIIVIIIINTILFVVYFIFGYFNLLTGIKRNFRIVQIVKV